MGFLNLLGAAVPWKVIGFGAGALAICGAVALILAQAKAFGRLETERIAAVASAAANAAAAAYERDENARIRAAAERADAAKATLRRKFDDDRRRIYDAPSTDDGPLAPVLRRQLDGLQQRADDDESYRAPAAGNSAKPAESQ
jgi:hypothetical protein